jgi:hypothetical protein
MANKTPKAVAETDQDDILVRAREDYERAREWWGDNQLEAKDDLRFARLGEQWPERIRKQREEENRPCLTFNKMPAFIRQVVNDARQNKPQIHVHAQDSSGDAEVAEIINGLIRNIETTSDSDIAYDTAIEHAVGQGFGFWRVNTAYTCDDAFDQDIVIERVANPFTVYGDPRSTAADSSDWNVAFVVTTMTRDEFEDEYPDAEKTDWEHDFRDCADWLDGEDVVVAEYWTREKVRGQIIALADGSVVKVDELAKLGPVQTVGQPRDTETYKVTQRIMSGAEVLKTVDWAGKYIPIVPVYGDEVIDEDGRRHFRSLIRDAKDPQRQHNYWRTTTTELVALAPKAPFMVEVDENGSMGLPDDEAAKYDTANTASHSYLAYRRGWSMPQRQPFAGVPAGALQEALNAADDMKAIIGIYDASLGARSNETSGRAIMARQREGDVSTFHFIDNLSRSIRHCGRIVLDLIGKVYTTERIVRVLGEDMSTSQAQIAPTGQPVSQMPQPDGSMQKVFDITVGKYDLTVKAGPSFTTMREENRVMMTEMAQAGGPEVAAVLLPRIAKLTDLPDADTIGAEIEAKLNPQPQGGIPPEMQEQIEQGMQRLQQLEGENQQLKMGQAEKQAELSLKAKAAEQKDRELEIKAFEAETARIQASQPTFVRAPSQQAM